MTQARRRATLAILAVALLAALLAALPSRGEAGADVSTVAAPATTAADVVPSTAPTTDAPTTTSTTEPATTTSTEAAPAEDTTTTEAPAAVRAAEAPSAPAAPAPPVTAKPTTTTTAAPPPPPPPPPPSSGDPTSIIRAIFGSHAEAALVIARCESSLNPAAVNPAGYHGLFQIGNGHAPRFESVTGTSWQTGRYDARANTTYAKWLFDGDGQTWRQWGCRHRL